MTDKLELKSSHEVVYTVDVADVNSIFYCKPTDPDILTVLMKDGKRLYCDEVCPVDSMQEEPISIDFEQELYKAFGQVKDFTLCMQIAKWFWDMGKNSQEPVSEDMEEYAIDYAESVDYRGFSNAPWNFVQDVFKAGAKWQITKLMNDATDVTVHIDAGGYPYTPEIELYDYDKDVPLAKEGDKYKVVLIKEV